MESTFLPFFLPSSHGALYGFYLPPLIDARPRGALLWLPPFAEEANCARRHVVAAARECQSQGYASLLIDPFGTGESDGELIDASWDIWRHNVVEAASWLRSRLDAPLWLAGVRAGALLAADAVSEVMPAGMICWQPVSSGRAVLDNFLRLKLASEWVQAESAKATDILGKLREQLGSGAAVEIAGYKLSAVMAAAIGGRTLSWPQQSCGRVACVEFRTRHDESIVLELSPAIGRLCGSWREQGLQLSSAALEAPPFWMSYEAPLTRGIGERTCRLIESLPP